MYQAERQEGELARVFEERSQQEKDIILEHVKPKAVKDEAPEWAHMAKSKRGEEYYSKLREVSCQCFKFQLTVKPLLSDPILPDSLG